MLSLRLQQSLVGHFRTLPFKQKPFLFNSFLRRRLSAHKHYDYIIVGGGSSGSVLANRLSANPNVSVLLVEAGKKDDYIWLHVPVGYLYCINNPRSDWCFETAAEKGLNNRKLIYPRGLGLGGCSLINGMIYMRGQKQDYDNWADAVRDPSWKWDAVLPLFKRQESYHSGTNEFHNAKGEWRVEKQRLRWDVLEVFRHAANDFGIPETFDFNCGSNFGVGYFDVNQQQGWRLSAYQAFVKPIRKRPNLHIMSETLVDHLLFSEDHRDTCYGISAVFGGQKTKFYASKEVILSAGSVGSVQILERSGIGNTIALKNAGIPIRHNLDGVGENLQDHLQLRMVFRVSDQLKTLNVEAGTYLGKAKIGIEYALFRTGPMSMAPSQLGAFCMSEKSETRPNLQYHVQPLSLPKFGEDLDHFNAFTASVCNLRPTSRGSIHIASPGNCQFMRSSFACYPMNQCTVLINK